MPMPRAPRSFLAAVVLALALAGSADASPRAAVTYAWPVSGTPVAGFAAPASPWGPGHRGVDLPAAAGTAVTPMAAGRVHWAGTIAGDTWATVAHADGVRTTYGPLRAPPDVHAGQEVGADTRLGRARGDAHGEQERLHVGARRDGRYIDPARLVAARDRVATLVGPGDVTAQRPTWPDGHMPLVPGTPPSANHLVVLAGLTSRTGAQPFDLAGLGYAEGSWEQYSYGGVDAGGTPVPYDHEDTWGDVHAMAVRLRDQLRAHAAEHPGQAVDLLGHSLGGLVASYYLLVLHDPADPSLPPIGRLATVASPLAGADSAAAVTAARQGRIARLVFDLLEVQALTPPGSDGPVMHDRMPVLDDLRAGSPVARAVEQAWRRHLEDPFAGPLATGTDVLTVGSVLDPVVNEHRSGLPGAPHASVLDPALATTHGQVPQARRTEDLLGAHLAGRDLPRGGLVDRLADAGAGPVSGAVAAVEYSIAAGLLALDHALP